MNNPAWILTHLAPVATAYADTLFKPRGNFIKEVLFARYVVSMNEWARYHAILPLPDDFTCKIYLERFAQLAQFSYFHEYALDTIPRNTPTWHAYLDFLRYYHG